MEGAPEPRRYLRLQAQTHRRRRQAAPRGRGGFGRGKLLGSPFKFAQHGQSGLWISELFPELAQAGRQALPAQRHAHRPAQPAAGVPPDALRHLPVPAAQPRRVGALRPGHRERRTCRASSRSARRRTTAARRTTAHHSCRRSTRGRGSVAARLRRRRAGEQPQEPAPHASTPSACSSTSSRS